jgi:hypothetical protein
MCIICEARANNTVHKLVPLTHITCGRCQALETIPPELVNLIYLSCSNCPLLTSIPGEPINLTQLSCSNCPLLTSIPLELVNLTHLSCSNCPLLISIPSELVNLDCMDCYWLPQNDPVRPSRTARVTIIQKWAKRSRKGRLLKQWMKTKEFNEWFYAPKGIGGRMHKKRIEQFLTDAL